MKKWLWKFSVVLFLAGLILSCGGGKKSSEAGKKITLRILMTQPEYQTGLPVLVQEYMKQHPNITIDLNSNSQELSALFASGEIPDIFCTEGYNNMKMYLDYIEDVSNQSWVDKVSPSARACMTLDGKVYGQPVSMAGEGVVYNKKMFAEHGWKVPLTRTEFLSLCKTIKAAGITALVNEFGDDWLLGQFAGNIFAAVSDSAGFLQKLYAGGETFSANTQFKNSFGLLDVMIEYGLPDSLSYSWNETCSAFALGEAAMCFEGDWLWETLYSLNPAIECGMFAFPSSDNPLDSKLLVDASWLWHIAKGSRVKETALDFLNWMASDPEAKRILLAEMRVVPVFSGWEYTANNQLALSTIDYMNNNMTYPWPWPKWPNGFRPLTGKAYQEYVAKNYTAAQTLAEFDSQWKNLAK
jgi:raffinose/stachyose/melibiose transport system substrate-binding protein